MPLGPQTVVDTKHLSASCAASRFASTALGDLYRELVTSAAPGAGAPIALAAGPGAEQFGRYHSGDAYHEAGWDAYVTGAVFIRLAELIYGTPAPTVLPVASGGAAAAGWRSRALQAEEQPSPASPVVASTPAAAPAPVVAQKTLTSMKVAELRAELKAGGHSTDGKKAELVGRLGPIREAAAALADGGGTAAGANSAGEASNAAPALSLVEAETAAAAAACEAVEEAVAAEGNKMHVMRGLHALTLDTAGDARVGRGPAFLLEGLPDRAAASDVTRPFGPDLAPLAAVRWLGSGRAIVQVEPAIEDQPIDPGPPSPRLSSCSGVLYSIPPRRFRCSPAPWVLLTLRIVVQWQLSGWSARTATSRSQSGTRRRHRRRMWRRQQGG